MGIVLYHPASATAGPSQQLPGASASLPVRVSSKSEAFCRQLVRQYRVNLLDHAVFQDKGIRVAGRDAPVLDSDKSDVNFFRLGMAAMHGDAKLVRCCTLFLHGVLALC